MHDRIYSSGPRMDYLLSQRCLPLLCIYTHLYAEEFKPAITDFLATWGQRKQAVNTTSTYYHFLLIWRLIRATHCHILI